MEGNPVEKIFLGRVPIHAAMSLCYFTTSSAIQQLVHQVKYKGQQQLALYMGQLIGRELKASGRFADSDILLPMPMFRTRLRQRGYNQATLLAQGISSITGIPVNDDLVSRVRHASTQTQKSREERWANMEGLFRINNAHMLKHKRIILVDDVITTGASLDAMATTIISSTTATISIATLAYAMK